MATFTFGWSEKGGYIREMRIAPEGTIKTELATSLECNRTENKEFDFTCGHKSGQSEAKFTVTEGFENDRKVVKVQVVRGNVLVYEKVFVQNNNPMTEPKSRCEVKPLQTASIEGKVVDMLTAHNTLTPESKSPTDQSTEAAQPSEGATPGHMSLVSTQSNFGHSKENVKTVTGSSSL